MEGHYKRKAVDGETIRHYLHQLSELISMRVFAGPYAWPPDKWKHKDVELFELNGFVAWTESGCHIYAWRPYEFFTVDIYSCKRFDAMETLSFTKDYFDSEDVVYTEI
jgi:S-adenosylmethionine/arginine decarboxylase-like enzyme